MVLYTRPYLRRAEHENPKMHQIHNIETKKKATEIFHRNYMHIRRSK